MKWKTFFIVVVSGATIGCMDIHLLDEMEVWDTDEGSASTNPDAESEDGTAGELMPPPVNVSDFQAPQLIEECETMGEIADGYCGIGDSVAAYFSLTTDEPAVVSMEESVNGAILSDDWDIHHELLFFLGPYEEASNAVVPISFGICDVNDNCQKWDTAASSIQGTVVRITEVLADCEGDEPDGEFVELVNWGDEAVDISGWMIDDNGDKNGDLIAAGTVLAAGEVVVVAAAGFVPLAGRVVELDGSLGSSGLKNSESESVELYDGAGNLVDVYQNEAQPPKEGVSFIRRHPKLPLGAPQLWIYHPLETSSPGVLDE